MIKFVTLSSVLAFFCLPAHAEVESLRPIQPLYTSPLPDSDDAFTDAEEPPQESADETSASSSQNYTPLPRLSVKGNTLTDPEGKPVTLRGVSLCSLEWHKPLKQINELMEAPRGWKGVNVIRLPVQPREWKKMPPEKYLKERLDPAVALCKKHNTYCVIDWHEIGDWTNPEKVKALEDFWKVTAIRYSNNPNILYEFFNEPTRPAKRSPENWLAWRDQAQKWVNQIRADAPDTVILVGSPHWSQMAKFAVDNPFSGSNLVYVMHVYPNWKISQWDNLFGEASASLPLFMSEWGYSETANDGNETQGTREAYGEPFKDYLQARPQISWTAWSFDPKCGPAMTGKDRDMGEFVKEWLMEEKAPK